MKNANKNFAQYWYFNNFLVPNVSKCYVISTDKEFLVHWLVFLTNTLDWGCLYGLLWICFDSIAPTIAMMIFAVEHRVTTIMFNSSEALAKLRRSNGQYSNFDQISANLSLRKFQLTPYLCDFLNSSQICRFLNEPTHNL